MNDQAEHWSRAAKVYEDEFVNPYLPEVKSPVQRALRRLAHKGAKVVADLGCGTGPLLPFLAEHFRRVWAVDFAEGMLARAKEQTKGVANIKFLCRPLDSLRSLHGKLDVAVAINSLVQPDVTELDRCLAEVRKCLKPGGAFLGIVPAMDAVHYQTLLLVDRALARGLPLEAARKNAADHNDHMLYDFAFSEFRFRGLVQHFWQPFEVRHRLAKAGFRVTRLRKVHLAWKQFACSREFSKLPPPWDWFFLARPV